MQTARVVKQFRFESAHQIPSHKGKCRNLHGHSYLLEVEVSGSINKRYPNDSSYGMVADFSDIKQIVNSLVIECLDHQNLNEVIPQHMQPTTAENLCWWVWERIWHNIGITFKGKAELSRVRIWETATCYAEITLEEWNLYNDADPEA